MHVETLTINQIAREAGVTIHQCRYLVEHRLGMEPVSRVGTIRVFSRAQAEKIKKHFARQESECGRMSP